jgi:hypothetical protein
VARSGELFRSNPALKCRANCFERQFEHASFERPDKLVEGVMSFYKVFYTDQPLPADTKPDFKYAMPLDFASKEESLSMAFKLIYSGATVWKIEGPDDFYLDRADVEREYRTFRSQ